MNRITTAAADCRDSRLGPLVAVACKAALTGGALLTSLYKQPHTITMKGKTDLVTEADLAAQDTITTVLAKDTPGIALLAEESAKGHTDNMDGQLWIVDPLDGTTNFAHGFPYFCVSIALLAQGKPQVCAIYSPCMDELFYACAGKGAWLNGDPIKVTATAHLIEALIGTGFPYDVPQHLQELIAQLKTVLPQVRDIRRAGAAALDLAYVACGRLDGFYERELQPWDTAAGWLLVEEAGGKVSNYEGQPYSVLSKEIVATNGSLHLKLLPLLR